MTLATLVNRLKAEGSIQQVRVNRYQINDTSRVRSLGLTPGTCLYTLIQIHQFFTEPDPHGAGYRFRLPVSSTSNAASTVRPSRNIFIPQESIVPESVRLRTITRSDYHTSGSGTSRVGVDDALRAIMPDADGVRRSYGLEWEIYSLTAQQEDKLARLLDTLPAHYTERDGSLSSSGVEIIFLPLGLDKIISTWKALQNFCRENNVYMNGTGAHITYGVSNSEASQKDLQIRINRIALAVKSVSTQSAIKKLFGRDFTGYACLPSSTTYNQHSNAWNVRRDRFSSSLSDRTLENTYELRLCFWEGDIDKITAFMRTTEFVFHRPFVAQDLINMFAIMGNNSDGE